MRSESSSRREKSVGDVSACFRWWVGLLSQQIYSAVQAGEDAARAAHRVYPLHGIAGDGDGLVELAAPDQNQTQVGGIRDVVAREGLGIDARECSAGGCLGEMALPGGQPDDPLVRREVGGSPEIQPERLISPPAVIEPPARLPIAEVAAERSPLLA